MAVLLTFVVLAVVLWRFNRGFWPGLSCCVAFLVSLPKAIQIHLPGSLPALTVHRLIVVLILFFWLREGYGRFIASEIPFRKLLLWIFMTQAVSVIFAADVIASIKELLYYSLENLLYFVLLVTVVREPQDGVRLVRSVYLGLLWVAVIAFVEKYKGYSPMQYFPDYYEGTVMSTFSHRILLGTAMAMGWSLCMLSAAAATTFKQRTMAWMTSLLCIAACYFAQSRGPWMGMLLAGVTFVILGSKEMRKWLLFVAVLAAIVWISNSGVRNTIRGRAGSTFVEESDAQVSYEWRWELWRKAWSEITKSPIRLALGYGPGASEALNWEGDVSFLDNYTDSFSSWDNNWAAYLLECGLLGFGVLLCFYAVLMCRMLKIWQLAQGKEKEFCTYIIGALVVFIFMQTNVKIFAPQVYFIFWTTAAAGIALGRRQPSDDMTNDSAEQEELTVEAESLGEEPDCESICQLLAGRIGA
jgi:O-antigen ligase